MPAATFRASEGSVTVLVCFVETTSRSWGRVHRFATVRADRAAPEGARLLPSIGHIGGQHRRTNSGKKQSGLRIRRDIVSLQWGRRCGVTTVGDRVSGVLECLTLLRYCCRSRSRRAFERLVRIPNYGGEMEDRGYPRMVLPAARTVRWTARRKRAVLMALDLGEISEEEVCRRYAMHPDELSAWRRGEVYILPANRRRRPAS